MTVDLRLGDCLELMPTLEDASIDAVIADIPYGTTACAWDTVIPFEPMWAQLKRIAKPRAAIVLFGSQPFTSALVMSNPKWFRYEWVWAKSHSSNFANAEHAPLKKHESIAVFSANGHTYNPQKQKTLPKYNRSGRFEGERARDSTMGRPDNLANVLSNESFPTSIIPFSCGRRADSVHPTQKPVALMEYLIRTYTNEGDTVLDFTMGSGTTGVACVNTGRSFIGFELREDYFAIAKRRIEEAQMQLSLPLGVPA